MIYLLHLAGAWSLQSPRRSEFYGICLTTKSQIFILGNLFVRPVCARVTSGINSFIGVKYNILLVSAKDVLCDGINCLILFDSFFIGAKVLFQLRLPVKWLAPSSLSLLSFSSVSSLLGIIHPGLRAIFFRVGSETVIITIHWLRVTYEWCLQVASRYCVVGLSPAVRSDYLLNAQPNYSSLPRPLGC